MQYQQILDEASNLVQRLIAERDKALAFNDFIAAKKRDSEARQSAFAFFVACSDPSFSDSEIPMMQVNAEQQAEIDRLVARGDCKVLEDTWSGLARSLEKAKRGF